MLRAQSVAGSVREEEGQEWEEGGQVAPRRDPERRLLQCQPAGAGWQGGWRGGHWARKGPNASSSENKHSR